MAPPSPTPPRRLAALLVLATVVALASSGCGMGGGARVEVSRAALTGGSIGRSVDLSGARFTVGSKEFTENVILGKITIYALRASGAQVRDQTGLSGSTIVRTALRNGQIDMYWGYAGTGWSLFLEHDKPVPDAMKQFRATAREDLRRNGIRWLGPASFGDSYAIARRSDAPGPVGDITKASQLHEFIAEHPEKATFCGAAEFLDRKFFEFQRAYNADFPAPNVYQNALALNYVNAAKGSPCNFAEVLTTDARIKTLDLTILEDDKHVFLTQLASLVTRNGLYKKHPELATLAERLGAELTQEQMIELNHMVDIEGKSADEAALYFLRQHGFIG